MPPPETFERHQTAVLWPAVSYDEYGEVTVGPPVELTVRWENTRKESVGRDGSPITIDAVVVVTQDVPLGSTMWQGSLEDWYGGSGSSSGSAGSASSVMEVVTFKSTPDIKDRFIRRTLGLAFYKDSLPTAST